MSTPAIQAGRGAKQFHGGRNMIGAPAPVTIRPGQTANIRPAGAQMPNQSSNNAVSPPRQLQAMDYKSAVSSAKLPGGLRPTAHSALFLSQQGQSSGTIQDFNLPSVDLMDNDAYDTYGDGEYGSHTQDIANRRLVWGPRQHDLMLQGMMELEAEQEDTAMDRQNQSSGDRMRQSTQHQEDDIQEEDGGTFEDAGEEKNTAEKEVSSDFDMEVRELLSAVDDIIEISGKGGEVATETLYLNSKVFAEGIRSLQNNSLVIHTVDLRVSLAYLERWVEITIHQLLGVKVASICQLDPYCFHVTVDSRKSRAHIFANSPLRMGNKMVFPLPWDTKFSTRDLKSRAVPVWLELSNVHPGLMNFGLNMLRKIGPIIYAAKNVETQRVNIIRGCVLMDLSKPLPEFVPIAVLERPQKLMKQKIRYLRLPDACFSCRQRGHLARPCPLNQHREENVEDGLGTNTGRRPTDAGNLANGILQDDFRTVRRKGKPRFQAPEIKKSMRVDNRYGILAEPVEEPNAVPPVEEETWEIRTKSAMTSDPTARKGTEGNHVSSLSEEEANEGARRRVQNMVIMEVVDLTKPKESTKSGKETGSKMVGSKHQQEDRDRRLSSAGAIAPTDSEGRKKLRNVCSWNINGTASDLRGRTIRSRIHHEYKDVDIFALQELKTQEWELENTLELMVPGSRRVVDFKENGWGGSALVLKPSITTGGWDERQWTRYMGKDQYLQRGGPDSKRVCTKF
ncbi:hypothetical protein R1sor_003184 [Riccia sorocarpa]|uniref:CCHC-type domain-containing protein n=1 Tax=Riccia sorocarpa TaxID=122646 RepID=A0ABD3H3X7_9MARC